MYMTKLFYSASLVPTDGNFTCLYSSKKEVRILGKVS